MKATEETLGKFLESSAASAWKSHKNPYFLSFLSPDFKDSGHDYRDVIGTERLKSAVKRLSENFNFDLVEHPTQKAKIGVVPKGEKFAFPTGDTAKRQPKIQSPSESFEERRRVVIDFLDALGRLPPDILEGVVIPTKVLVRLIARI